MKMLTNFINTSLQWLNTISTHVSNWIIISLRTIVDLIYLFAVAIITISIAIYHWLVSSLTWLVNAVMTFCFWLGTSLKITEYSSFYSFGIVAVVLIAISILLVGLSSRTRELESQNRVLHQQNAKLHLQQREIDNQLEEDKRERRIQSLVNSAVKIGRLFLDN